MKKFVKSALIVATNVLVFMGILYFPLIKKYNSVKTELIKTSEELEAFHDYYISSENLLDELFLQYDWCDAMDPVYYYEAVEQLYDKEYLPLYGSIN